MGVNDYTDLYNLSSLLLAFCFEISVTIWIFYSEIVLRFRDIISFTQEYYDNCIIKYPLKKVFLEIFSGLE